MPTTVRILGPATVTTDGAPAEPGGHKVARVLAALAIRRGDPVTTERLIDDVWGEAAPSRARASLQMHITKLRRLLTDTPVDIVTTSTGYRLEAPQGAVDVDEFVRLATDARTARGEERWETASDRARRALETWRGDRIEALDDVPSLAGDVAGLLELRRQMRIVAADAALALGDHDSIVAELEDAVTIEPFVERYWELLMLALYRCGRQADALTTYRRAAAVLGEELGIEPGPALTRLEDRILTQDPSLLHPAERTSSAADLPARSTPLVGRGHETSEAIEQTGENRILTILGPGGVGKTTLALEVGRRLAERCPDGGLLIDLTACDDDDAVTQIAAEQLGLNVVDDPLESLIDHLRSRSMVAVVDNCEQVLAGAGRMLSMLAARCPELILVATSRQRLDVRDEVCLQLEPLDVPTPDEPIIDLDRFSAVRLFVDRARAVHGDLSVTADDLPVFAEICRRLDGLPLAIELVAAWANVLTARDIAARLGDLAPLESRRSVGDGTDRHAGVDDAIEWSYRLLSSVDQTAFDRLAVFRSTFDLDGASAVLGLDDDATLRTLGALVDASLLTSELDGASARYRMLETIRAFGARRLAQRTDQAEVADRHRHHVLRAVAPAEDGEAGWFERVQAMLPDLRVVLDWAEEHAPETLVEVAERLRPFWTQRGFAREIEPRLEEVVGVVNSASAWYTLGVMRYAHGAFDDAVNALERGLSSADDDRDRARLTNALGVLALERGEYEAAAARYRRAEELFAVAGLIGGVAASRLNQGIADLNLGSHERAADHFEAARVMFREQGDAREEAHALLRLAFVAELQGRPEVALERAHTALGIARTLGAGLALADALQYTADFEVGSGSATTARHLLVEAIDMFKSLGHLPGLQRAMITATSIAITDQQWTEAAEMRAYAMALRDELGIPIPAANQAAAKRQDDAVTTTVPPARLDALAERARLASADEMATRCVDLLAWTVDGSA